MAIQVLFTLVAVAIVMGISGVHSALPRALAVVSPDWKSQNQVFGDLAAVVEIFTTDLTGSGEREELLAGAVKANFFQRIGVRPLMGRAFQAGEDRRGREHVVILSHQLWRRRFGGDAGVLGRSITLSGDQHRVIGVLPPDFTWNNGQADVWVPAIDPARDGRATGGWYLSGAQRFE
jgi:putative ABC transport system permease protein